MEIRILAEDQIRLESLDGYFQFPHLFEVVDCSTRPPLSFVFFTCVFLRIRRACSLLILHADLGRKLITTTPNLLILL